MYYNYMKHLLIFLLSMISLIYSVCHFTLVYKIFFSTSLYKEILNRIKDFIEQKYTITFRKFNNIILRLLKIICEFLSSDSTVCYMKLLISNKISYMKMSFNKLFH